MSHQFTIGLPPSANRYWRKVGSRVYKSAEATTYIQQTRWQLLAAGVSNPITGPVVVELHVYRKHKRGDLDNYNKILLDALQGLAYHDDKQVIELHAYRHDDKHNPRVEVRVKSPECEPKTQPARDGLRQKLRASSVKIRSRKTQ